ncbi:MAG: hypothetical protein DWQ29_21680 [Planctomycetota bacterium]|nr:MAG: hypothetical protein DWQ29_21680 [Planctomycetota bacterium]
MSRTFSLAALLAALLIASPAQAAEREETLEFLRFLVGTWTISNDQGLQIELKVRESEAKSCFIFEAENVTIIHGWNPATNNMKIVSFHKDGSHGVGYASLENETIIGHSDTATPDGQSRSADWTVEPRGDDQFVFKTDFKTGNAELVFDRE